MFVSIHGPLKLYREHAISAEAINSMPYRSAEFSKPKDVRVVSGHSKGEVLSLIHI